MLDPRVDGPSGGSASSGGDGGGTAVGGTGGAGAQGGEVAQGAGGQGGAGAQGGAGGVGGSPGGAGGAPPVLSDDGLVARYYLDEASDGQGPNEALDAAPNPLNLPITYSAGMTYAEEGGHRGVAWNAIDLLGNIATPVGGTKVETALDGGTTGTIEVVVRLVDANPSSSRLVHIGEDSESGRFTLYADDNASAGFDWLQPGAESAVWPVPFLASGRTVLHVVLDTDLADVASRVRLYVDGNLATENGTGIPPLLGETTKLIPTAHFSIGNRFIGARSFVGVLFYAAVYSTALTPADVATNVAVLTASDDSP